MTDKGLDHLRQGLRGLASLKHLDLEFRRSARNLRRLYEVLVE